MIPLTCIEQRSYQLREMAIPHEGVRTDAIGLSLASLIGIKDNWMGLLCVPGPLRSMQHPKGEMVNKLSI